MKQIITVVIFIVAFATSVSAQSMIISGGLATPSDKFNQVYTTETLSKFSSVQHQASKNGYFLGAKLRIPIDNFAVSVSAAYNHFPETQMSVTYNNSLYQLSVSNNIIPISAGLNYYLFKSVVGMYGLADVSYNYIFSSVDYSGLPMSLDKKPTDNRIGFGVGLGFDINLKVILLNVEAKYNIANQIGAKSGEEKKSYLNLGVGIGL